MRLLFVYGATPGASGCSLLYRVYGLYRVHFKWKGKEVQLTAKSLDLTHPYFVSIKDIVFKRDQQIIINPTAEDVRRTFGRAEHLMIPFQTVALIEEFPESESDRIRPFTLVEEQTDEPDDDEDLDDGMEGDDSSP